MRLVGVSDRAAVRISGRREISRAARQTPGRQAASDDAGEAGALAAGVELADADASDEDDDAALALSPAAAVSPDFAVAAFDEPPLLPPRKSVTYQPEPFNWKPAAVTCLENASFPQAGHCVSGASLSF